MGSESYTFPASFAQQRLWFLDQLDPGKSVYNMLYALRLNSRLNVEALHQGLNEIVQRHESLRTTFTTEEGQPLQVIAAKLRIELPIIDLSGFARTERDAEALRRAQRESESPFDLATGPLLRTKLLLLDEDEHVLLIAVHHIVSDGWSMGVFFRELAALYEAFSAGRSSPLPELPIQYADYAVWQRQVMQPGDSYFDDLMNWWMNLLANSPPPLNSVERSGPSAALPPSAS